MRRQPPRAGHGPCSWEERGELGFPLTQVLFRRYRKSECLDQNSRRIHGLLSDHLRLQRPVEGVSVAAHNALGDLRVERLSVQQQPIHVVNNMGYGSRTRDRKEHTSELQSHSFISYAVFCLKKKQNI